VLERMSLLKRERQSTTTAAVAAVATGPFYTGWAMEAYPEMSASEMRAIVRRQKEQGCNVVWIGHNNPGVVDQHKVEPGLSYAIYRAYTDSTHPRHDQSQAMVQAQHRLLTACRAEGMPVVFPVGYQIQMGETWEQAHLGDLTTDYNGQALNIGGHNASLFSPAYQTDIRTYYRWAYQQFVVPYRDIILMVNLSDEPQGGDYSVHADGVFRQRHGYGMREVGADRERLQALGAFQTRYIVEYAIWSANLWQVIAPGVRTTMSFCGHLARYAHFLPEIEPLFSDTPANFTVTFDAYPRDGFYTDSITDSDITGLFILARALGRYSARYNHPLWLWSTANSWGLGQASHDKADIADAAANALYLAQLVAQAGGHLEGITFWNYNVKQQGLYNDTNPIVYDPDEMFHHVSGAGLWARAAMASGSEPVRVLIFAPAAHTYEAIGSTKTWLHVFSNYRLWDLNALARNDVTSDLTPHLTADKLEGIATILLLAYSPHHLSEDELSLLRTFLAGGGTVVAKRPVADLLVSALPNPQAATVTPYLTRITFSEGGILYSSDHDVERIFSDTYRGELGGFWREVLGINKLQEGYVVASQDHVLLYNISGRPATFDVDAPFAYWGSRYHRNGSPAAELRGTSALRTTLEHHEYAWLKRAEEPPHQSFRGEYYNNISLGGSPAFIRDEATIDFDWGQGSPGAGLGVDLFSVRWVGRWTFVQAGRYRFHTLTDDGVRLWVDGQLLIDDWHDHPATERTGDILLSAGEHEIRMEYYENRGFAVAKLWWELMPQVEGFRGEYFDNPHLSGTPAFVRDDAAIDFDWGKGAPAARIFSDRFSVRWTGRQPFETRTYRFHTLTDDGVRLWVDGQLVIDDWHDHPALERTADAPLTAGEHDIKMEYYENGGFAVAKLWWELEPQVEGFHGEYFNNTDLVGTPAFTREEAIIDFDWGLGSPGVSLGADHFSVRWTGRATFAADTYRFFTLTDDGVRLWVDGLLLMDDWHDHPATHRSADITLSAGQHDIKMEYYEKTGLALAKLWWVRRDRVETFRGEYFNNPTLSGPPTLVRDDEVIDFNWGAGSPAPEISSDQFSVRWTGKRNFEAGTYRFHALTDDGVRVWVDGRLIIDQWHDHPPSHYQAEMHLVAGQHDIQVEYYERGGGAVAKFWWGRAV
jgi:hypothetical protein